MRYALYTIITAVVSVTLTVLYGYRELYFTVPVYVAGMTAMCLSQVCVRGRHPPRVVSPVVRGVACMCHTVPPPGCRVGYCPEMIFRSAKDRCT